MRKPVLLLITLLLAFAAHAQFEQGRMMAGGTIGLGTSTSKYDGGEKTKTFSYTFAPSFGYFVIDNLALGLAINTSVDIHTPDNDNYVNKWSNSSTEFQPFARYYLPARIFFHGEYGIGFGNLHTDYIDEDDDDSKYTPSHWALAVGYAIMLNDNVAIEPMLGYESIVSKYEDSKLTNNGLFLRASFQVYLGRK